MSMISNKSSELQDNLWVGEIISVTPAEVMAMVPSSAALGVANVLLLMDENRAARRTLEMKGI